MIYLLNFALQIEFKKNIYALSSSYIYAPMPFTQYMDFLIISLTTSASSITFLPRDDIIVNIGTTHFVVASATVV